MTPQVGTKLRDKTVDTWLAGVAPQLYAGETVLAVARVTSLKPMLDGLVVTNARVLGLSSVDGIQVKLEVPASDVATVEIQTRKLGVKALVITRRDGGETSFGTPHADDHDLLLRSVRQLAAEGAPADVSGAAVAAPPAAIVDCGREVAREIFDGRTICLYANGYVLVSSFPFGRKGTHERLVSIESSADVLKKNGLWRGGLAVATSGLSMVTSSNKRGDVYLTIVTDRNVYSLRECPPTAGNMQRVKKLEALGKSLVAGAQRDAVPSPPRIPAQPSPAAPAPSGPAEELMKLAALREQGLLSDEEFAAAKARVLGI